ncbi:MAG: GlsB/YeaQ/YmgE family stress response membrane protein [Candidatus Binatia bacterium]
MGETLEKVAAYLQPNPVLSLGVAFVAGFAAMKTVAYDQRAGFILFSLVGVVGLFLGEFVLVYYGLDGYLEPISEFRILFDFIAAYIGSFLVAAIIHFIKPT